VVLSVALKSGEDVSKLIAGYPINDEFIMNQL